VHLQDDVSSLSPIGNIFLTNIHRVSISNNSIPTEYDDNLTDFLIGKRAMRDTRASDVDLGKIVREVDELMILNDEAHHIWDA
jgi:type III restriction enzyme